MSEKQHDYVLDLLKIFFCLGVLFDHTPSSLPIEWYTVFRFIGSLAVPGFFAISGYLLVMVNKDVKKIYTKVLPRYVVIFLLWASVYWLVNWIPTHDGWDGFLFFICENAEGWHLWYLRCLIAILLVYPLLRAIADKEIYLKVYAVLWFFLVGVRFTMTYLDIHEYYWRVFQIPLFELRGFVAGTWSGFYPEEAMGLVLIGGAFIHYVKTHEDARKWNWLYALLFVGSFAVAMGISAYQAHIDPEKMTYGIMEPFNFFTITFVCGFLGLVLCNVKFRGEAHPIIGTLAPLTLGVYVIHPLVIKFIKHYYDAFGRTYDLLMYLLVILASFLIVWVIRLILPKKIRSWII